LFYFDFGTNETVALTCPGIVVSACLNEEFDQPQAAGADISLLELAAGGAEISTVIVRRKPELECEAK
jgi:hypothetical protein